MGPCAGRARSRSRTSPRRRRSLPPWRWEREAHGSPPTAFIASIPRRTESSEVRSTTARGARGTSRSDHGIWVAGGAEFLTVAVAEKPTGPRTRPPGVLDARSGTYLGAGIGDTREVLRRSLGDGRAFDPTARLAVGLRTPSSHTTVDPTLDVAYDGFTLSFTRRPGGVTRVRELTVSVPGARTRRGLRVGDPLERTTRSYPDARCDLRAAGVDGIAGGDLMPREPLCLFGESECVVIQAAGDPIHTLAAVDLTQPSGTPLPIPFERRRRCARSACPR